MFCSLRNVLTSLKKCDLLKKERKKEREMREREERDK